MVQSINIWVVSSCLQHVKCSKKGTLYSTVQYIYSAIQEKKFPPYLCKGIFLPENPLKTTFNYLKVVRNHWFPTSFEWHLRPPRCLPWVRRTICRVIFKCTTFQCQFWSVCSSTCCLEFKYFFIFLIGWVKNVSKIKGLFPFPHLMVPYISINFENVERRPIQLESLKLYNTFFKRPHWDHP